MSSAEKMKIELAKVRDEFKMSESDCGSSRVQGKGFEFFLFNFQWFHRVCMDVYIFDLGECFKVLFVWLLKSARKVLNSNISQKNKKKKIVSFH